MTTALVRPDILYAWKGPSLLITNTRGDCSDDQRLSGYYFREARFLRTLRLEIDGDPPWLCEAASLDPHTLSFTYVHPEVAEYGGEGSGQPGDAMPENARGLLQRALVIRLQYLLTLGGLTVQVAVTNHSKRTTACSLTWHVAADFADIQEAQSGQREQEGAVESAATGSCVTFTYEHPRLRYRAAVTPAGQNPGRSPAHRSARESSSNRSSPSILAFASQRAPLTEPRCSTISRRANDSSRNGARDSHASRREVSSPPSG